MSSFDTQMAAGSLMDWLFGLKRISWSDPRAALSWRYPLPPWVWALIVLAALGLALVSYHRLMAPRWGRLAIAPVRALLIVFLAALLAGPMLVVQQEKQEPGSVLMLVDRSASMKVRDALYAGAKTGGEGGVVPQSRHEALRRGLAEHAAVFGPQRLAASRQLLWLGFDAGAFEIPSPVSDPGSLDEPDGDATALRTAIEQGLQRAAGQAVLGIVLFTDGRSPQGTGPDLVRRLKQRGVSVFPVPLGGALMPLDLAVRQVDAPDKALVRDHVPVTVWVERAAAAEDIAGDRRVVVRLVDSQDAGVVLDEKVVTESVLDQPVHLRARWQAVGPVAWRVEVAYEQAAGPVTEALTENNSQRVHIEFVDRPVRVLYVEGPPRWEYRFLKNLLVREKSIQSSVFLVSADSAFAQEGDQPITRLPRDVEEFELYDVIVIGDVNAQYFSQEQLNLIRDQVAIGGSGLLWIGGSQHPPRQYQGTVLADLMPMRRPGSVERLGGGPFKVRPTPFADALSVLLLTGPPQDDPDRTGWPAALRPLYWVQGLEPLKPTAEVLATVEGGAGESAVLIATLRYGAGQVAFVGTDETWRWRHGRGELYFEQFWTQLIQLLGRSRIQQDTRRVRLEASHRRPPVHAAVSVSLSMHDAMLTDQQMPKIDVSVQTDPDGAEVDLIELVRTAASTTGTVRPRRGVKYEAVWRPRAAGQFLLRVVEPQLEDLNITWGPLQVTRDDTERTQRLVDHDRLATLAADTDGQVIPLAELDTLDQVVRKPNRTPNDIAESLWDSPITLLVVLVLLTIEWVCRKWIHLA